MLQIEARQKVRLKEYDRNVCSDSPAAKKGFWRRCQKSCRNVANKYPVALECLGKDAVPMVLSLLLSGKVVVSASGFNVRFQVRFFVGSYSGCLRLLCG